MSEEKILYDNYHVIFLRSDSVEDWYQCPAEFKPETIKVMYDSNGVVCSLNRETDARGIIDVSVFSYKP